MLHFILRRLLLSVPFLWALLTIIFITIRIIPGDPTAAVLGSYASEASIKALQHQMGLDKPIYLQYLTYLSDLAQGNLGKSMVTGQPIANQLWSVLPYTLDLTFGGILLGILFGLPLGILLALKRNSLIDYVGRVISLTGISLPIFYLAILLLVFFGVKLNLFPVSGGGDLHHLSSRIHHLILPSFTLGILMMAYLTRMTRSSMLEVLKSDYVRTARAKGLREKKVIVKHAFKNTLIPVISLLGIYTGMLIGSSVMTEIVFNRPGLGSLLVGALMQRDYTTTQSVLTVYAFFIVLINLLTDLSYGFVDPRIKYD
jgi:ABC-type dipeptide/oligopeptide/nickel transport system permease component